MQRLQGYSELHDKALISPVEPIAATPIRQSVASTTGRVRLGGVGVGTALLAEAHHCNCKGRT